MGDTKSKAHYIAATAIIRRADGKYLIVKRGPDEKLFANKWCVPGGKLEHDDFHATPKDTDFQWFGILGKSLQREVLEETSLHIKNLEHVWDISFFRPNGHATLVFSMMADHERGEVRLAESELVDHAWVTLEEAKDYDLIENIYEQLIEVDRRHNQRT